MSSCLCLGNSGPVRCRSTRHTAHLRPVPQPGGRRGCLVPGYRDAILPSHRYGHTDTRACVLHTCACVLRWGVTQVMFLWDNGTERDTQRRDKRKGRLNQRNRKKQRKKNVQEGRKEGRKEGANLRINKPTKQDFDIYVHMFTLRIRNYIRDFSFC